MRRDLDALDGESFDLVILGGGITGAGVALDAVLRGLRVALIDRGDFASGTSSISSKLIHGGLRYLEQGQIGLVREALLERGRLLRNAPHLVWPLPFMTPFYRGARIPGWKFRLGMLLYDALAGQANLWRSRPCSPRWMREAIPGLRQDGLFAGARYADAQTDDARLCLAVVQTATTHGAVAVNYVEAIALDPARGLVQARDHISGREVRLQARVILNATGPHADSVRRMAGEDEEPLLAPTKGVHLVLPDRRLPSGLLLLHPRDGRVFFVLPWLGKTLAGTTDTDCAGSPDEACVTDADIAYLLDGYNAYLKPTVERKDVLGHFVGVRPLLRARPGEPSSRSREYRILQDATGLITVVGGKYTTYRAMAEQITDTVLHRLGLWHPCRTRSCRLEGAPAGPWSAYASTAVTTLCRLRGLSESSARHLVGRYGSRAGQVAQYCDGGELARPVVPGEPDLVGELAYQQAHEMAVRPEDFLLRRTHLGLFHPHLLAQRGPAGFRTG